MQTSEDNFIEYKQNVAEGVAKEIVAFLNSEPGRIIIGINKKREVVGIEEGELDDAQRTISDVITDQISPRCIEFVRQTQGNSRGKKCHHHRRPEGGPPLLYQEIRPQRTGLLYQKRLLL